MNVKYFVVKLFFIIVLMFNFLNAEISAQEKNLLYANDTLDTINSKQYLFMPLIQNDLLKNNFSDKESNYIFNNKKSFYLPTTDPIVTFNKNIYFNEYNRFGVIGKFKKGEITGYTSQQNFIGLGLVTSTNFRHSYQINERFQSVINFNISRYKYDYINPSFSFGADIMFSYRLRDNITFNTFGSYHKGTYYPIVNYGVFFEIDITNRFGTDLGVHRHYNPIYKRWDTVPIIAPYYKLNNKVKLGMDFGELIQDMLLRIIK